MTRRRKGAGLAGLPDKVRLLTQTIDVATANNLHHMADPDAWVHESEDGKEPVEPHGHRAYGVYDAGQQVITLDDALGFERARETFLHENLHAILSISQLDGLIESAQDGFSEHIVASMSPVLLSWMRENPDVIAYLMEVQS